MGGNCRCTVCVRYVRARAVVMVMVSGWVVGWGGGGSSKSLPRRLPFLLLSAAVLLALSPSPGRRGLLCGCRTTIEKEKKCLKKYT